MSNAKKPKPLLARKLVSPLAALVDDRLSHPERMRAGVAVTNCESEAAE